MIEAIACVVAILAGAYGIYKVDSIGEGNHDN